MNSSKTASLEHFQRLYASNDDPWNVKNSWYEQRKRALVLACVPKKHFPYVYEPACGNGEMTLALAQRCDKLLAADGAEAAVAITRDRLEQASLSATVSVQLHRLPHDWPDARQHTFDLILISELGYYLELDALNSVVAKATASLAQGGTLLLCHALAPFGDRILSTEQVHGAFDTSGNLQRFLYHKENDFLIEGWVNSRR